MRCALLHDGKYYPFEADSIEDGERIAECYVAMLESEWITCCCWSSKPFESRQRS